MVNNKHENTSQSSRLEQIPAWIALIVITGFIILAAHQLFASDYANTGEFLTYRLAETFKHSSTFTYNSSEPEYYGIGPSMPLLLAISPLEARTTALILGSFALGIATLAQFALLKTRMTTGLAILTALLFLLSTPAWLGLRLTDNLVFVLGILALLCLDKQRYKIAGLLAGLTIMIDVAAIALILTLVIWIWLRRDERKYEFLKIVWLILCVWVLYTVAAYDHLNLAPAFIETAPLYHTIWAVLLLPASMIIMRTDWTILLVMPIWSALLILGNTLAAGQITEIANAPLAASLAIATATFITQLDSQWHRSTSIMAVAIFGLGLAVSYPQTRPTLQAEIERAETLSSQSRSSVMHSGTDATSYYLGTGIDPIYVIGGQRNTKLDKYLEENDLESAIILFAPDQLIIENPDSLSLDRLRGLDYTQSEPGLFNRTAQLSASSFDKTDINIEYNPDIALTSISLDTVYLGPAHPLRIGLNWQLARHPDLPLGIHINIISSDGNVVASTVDILAPEIWGDLNKTTYHALEIAPVIEPDLLTISIGLEYRSGMIATHEVARVAVPPPWVKSQSPLDEIGPVQLMNLQVRMDEGSLLTLDTCWSTSISEDLSANLQMFIHITTEDDNAPLAQIDGPPASGRYPTQFWREEDLVQDVRTLDLQSAALDPGTYTIRAGFYDATGTRLSDSKGDYLVLGHIHIDDNRTIQVESEYNATDACR